MSDMENRVYGLEAVAYETRANVERALDELTLKADREDLDKLKTDYLDRISFLEHQYYQIMKFLEENWGITNVDDLI